MVWEIEGDELRATQVLGMSGGEPYPIKPVRFKLADIAYVESAGPHLARLGLAGQKPKLVMLPKNYRNYDEHLKIFAGKIDFQLVNALAPEGTYHLNAANIQTIEVQQSGVEEGRMGYGPPEETTVWSRGGVTTQFRNSNSLWQALRHFAETMPLVACATPKETMFFNAAQAELRPAPLISLIGFSPFTHLKFADGLSFVLPGSLNMWAQEVKEAAPKREEVLALVNGLERLYDSRRPSHGLGGC